LFSNTKYFEFNIVGNQGLTIIS